MIDRARSRRDVTKTTKNIRLTTTYLNEPIELLDGEYGQAEQDQLQVLPKLYNQLIGPVTALRLHRPEIIDFSMYTASCDHSPINRLFRDLTLRSAAVDSMHIPGGGKGEGMKQPFSALLAKRASGC